MHEDRITIDPAVMHGKPIIKGPIIMPDLAQKIERAFQKIMALGGYKVRFIILDDLLAYKI